MHISHLGPQIFEMHDGPILQAVFAEWLGVFQSLWLCIAGLHWESEALPLGVVLLLQREELLLEIADSRLSVRFKQMPRERSGLAKLECRGLCITSVAV